MKVPERLTPTYVRQNMRKVDPARILEIDGTNAKTRNGKHTRVGVDLKGTVEMFGYDIERRVWEVINEEGCGADAESETCVSLRDYFVDVFGAIDSIDQ